MILFDVKLLIVSDNTKAAEKVGNFQNELGKKSAKKEKKATNLKSHPEKIFKIATTIGTASLDKNPKAALSFIPNVETLIILAKKFIFETLFRFSFIKMSTANSYPVVPS